LGEETPECDILATLSRPALFMAVLSTEFAGRLTLEGLFFDDKGLKEEVCASAKQQQQQQQPRVKPLGALLAPWATFLRRHVGWYRPHVLLEAALRRGTRGSTKKGLGGGGSDGKSPEVDPAVPSAAALTAVCLEAAAMVLDVVSLHPTMTPFLRVNFLGLGLQCRFLRCQGRRARSEGKVRPVEGVVFDDDDDDDDYSIRATESALRTLEVPLFTCFGDEGYGRLWVSGGVEKEDKEEEEEEEKEKRELDKEESEEMEIRGDKEDIEAFFPPPALVNPGDRAHIVRILLHWWASREDLSPSSLHPLHAALQRPSLAPLLNLALFSPPTAFSPHIKPTFPFKSLEKLALPPALLLGIAESVLQK